MVSCSNVVIKNDTHLLISAPSTLCPMNKPQWLQDYEDRYPRPGQKMQADKMPAWLRQYWETYHKDDLQ